MDSLPIELVFLLLFGLAILVNFFKQKAAAKQRAEAPQDEVEQEELNPEQAWSGPSAAELAAQVTGAAARRRAEALAMMPRRPQRRFSRQTLLGSRRKVQDAFVLAAILGPCRGDEPHEIK